jgi:hypothetical protein
LEVQLTDQLSEVNAALKAAAVEPPGKPSASALPEVDPAFAAWVAKNTWFGKDVRRTNLALSIGNAMRADPDYDNLQGVPFYEKIVEELKAREAGTTHDKVNGSAGSSSGSGGGGGKKGYADLDADAKRICDADAKRFTGEGKMFKTVADYRSWYASQVLGE